jgi:hypothetical protein
LYQPTTTCTRCWVTTRPSRSVNPSRRGSTSSCEFPPRSLSASCCSAGEGTNKVSHGIYPRSKGILPVLRHRCSTTRPSRSVNPSRRGSTSSCEFPPRSLSFQYHSSEVVVLRGRAPTKSATESIPEAREYYLSYGIVVVDPRVDRDTRIDHDDATRHARLSEIEIAVDPVPLPLGDVDAPLGGVSPCRSLP